MGTFVGAYWDVRDESIDECAERIAALLPRLAEIDPLLSGWRDKAMTKKEALAAPVVGTDRDDLIQRLRRGLMPGAQPSAEGAGFSVFWWNGHSNKDGGATLNVTNAGSRIARLPRAVVVNIPDQSTAAQRYSASAAKQILQAVIETFEPKRAVWLDDSARDAQTEPDVVQPDGSVKLGKLVGQPAGWATYLADSEPTHFDRRSLPGSAAIDRVGDGTLVLLGDDPANPPLGDVLAVRAAMGYRVPQGESQAAPTVSPSDSPRTAALRGEERESAAGSLPHQPEQGDEGAPGQSRNPT
ncbi:Imm52 family immunity protein [Mycolicibacterium stellerae]|uniref:Imm52 family immunity protein n=1 Tax=Mycolicibacterium stellerae TaxID=2358193 RepID=UPI000F0B2554|nr:Imm52 family immunity protein [Mycolicibacterium stellerae]